jgi:hypothetical protein
VPTVTRMPRRHGLPPMTLGEWVTRASRVCIQGVYQNRLHGAGIETDEVCRIVITMGRSGLFSGGSGFGERSATRCARRPGWGNPLGHVMRRQDRESRCTRGTVCSEGGSTS